MASKRKRAKAIRLITQRYEKAITALAEGDELGFYCFLNGECEFCRLFNGICSICPVMLLEGLSCDNIDGLAQNAPYELVCKCKHKQLTGDALLVAMLSLYGYLGDMK